MSFKSFLAILLLATCHTSLSNNKFLSLTVEQRAPCSLAQNDYKKSSETEAYAQVKQAKIVLLNKVTAKREIVTVSSDSEIKFGSIVIRVLECWKALDPTKSDNLIFVEIFEFKKSLEPSLILRGWISGSHPGYCVLEHYAYAIGVLECF